jgi:hypothetical protein
LLTHKNGLESKKTGEQLEQTSKPVSRVLVLGREACSQHHTQGRRPQGPEDVFIHKRNARFRDIDTIYFNCRNTAKTCFMTIFPKTVFFIIFQLQ